MNRITALLSAIKSGNQAAMATAFSGAIREKVNVALDVRKVALTSEIYSKVNEGVVYESWTAANSKVKFEPSGKDDHERHESIMAKMKELQAGKNVVHVSYSTGTKEFTVTRKAAGK